jgi:hypothetical protein
LGREDPLLHEVPRRDVTPVCEIRDGGPERRVLDSVEQRAFFPAEDGIYHIARADETGAYPLRFFDFASGKGRLLARFEGQLGLGLTVSPDRKTMLFSVGKPISFDLMLIENFR